MARSKKITGVGDVISVVTKALGIEECPECIQRRERLNKMFPFLNPKRELNEEEKQLILEVSNSKVVKSDKVDRIFKLYNEVFNSKLEKCLCPGLFKVMIERLIKLSEV